MHHLKSIPFLLTIFLFCLSYNPAQGQLRQIGQELHRLSLTKDGVGLVNSLNRLGTLYRTRNADSCFYYGMKAKGIATSLHYQKGQTEADRVIAYALFKRGLYAQSLELLSKILSQYQKLADTINIVNVYVDMADVLNKDISDKTKVVALLQKAIQTGRKLKQDSIMSGVYMNYCNRNGNLPADSISYYLGRSREIAGRYKDEHMLIFNRLWQVRLLILQGQKQTAFPLIKQVMSEARRAGDVTLEISSRLLMVAYCGSDPKMALEYCYQAYEVARKSGDKELQIYILTNALGVAEHLGNKNKIIAVHVELEKAMIAEKESTKRFIGDYVRYNAIQDDNKLLSEKNAQRKLWLLIVSFSATIILMATYLVMLSRSRKAKVQIAALNEMADMQIIEMEEAKHQAAREEQQRLGQDLHDGLSSSIAAIRHRLEVLSIDTEDPLLKNELDSLQAETAAAYEAARSKSHEWFGAVDGQQELSFEKQVSLLTDGALPNSRYNKTIQIDDNSLVNAGTDMRIALLRMVKEAVTNIIKHARAKNVGILVYEEEGSVVLVVSDDGIGLDKKRSGKGKAGMGLESVRRRVQYLNGRIDINSSAGGTELIVTIPLVFSLAT